MGGSVCEVEPVDSARRRGPSSATPNRPSTKAMAWTDPPQNTITPTITLPSWPRVIRTLLAGLRGLPTR